MPLYTVFLLAVALSMDAFAVAVATGCAVRAALEAGEIDKTRYESYVTLYNEAKEVKEWQM